jgi:hypothetical protein
MNKVKINIKITILWDVTPYSLVPKYQRFGGTYCIHLSGVTAELTVSLELHQNASY